MLILSRRPTESLVIGTDVVITVLAIKGNQVRLGISAPKDIVIDREEVHQRKLAEYTVTLSRPSAERDRTRTAAASTRSAL
jgi:carbon storage regulator